MNRQTTLLFICLLLIAAQGFCQNPVQNINGRVFDASTEEGLPFGTVKLSYENRGVTTDSLGFFILRDIPVGRYDIEASYMGYAPVVIKDVIVTSSKETRIEIPLQELASELAEVVVTPKVIKYMP